MPTQRLLASFPDPVELHRRHPARYPYVLESVAADMVDLHPVGAVAGRGERLVRVRGGSVEPRPIAGPLTSRLSEVIAEARRHC
jgi:hypothetical protein